MGDSEIFAEEEMSRDEKYEMNWLNQNCVVKNKYISNINNDILAMNLL